MAPPLQRLADHLLGEAGPTSEFVRTRREAGRPWRLIARDLLEATGGEVDVAHETLRSWFPETPEVAAS